MMSHLPHWANGSLVIVILSAASHGRQHHRHVSPSSKTIWISWMSCGLPSTSMRSLTMSTTQVLFSRCNHETKVYVLLEQILDKVPEHADSFIRHSTPVATVRKSRFFPMVICGIGGWHPRTGLAGWVMLSYAEEVPMVYRSVPWGSSYS